MNDEENVQRFLTDWDSLPEQWPTHRHSAEFWEHLGRAIASFGFLEDTLKKAIFVFTGTRRVPPEEVDVAVQEWGAHLERVLTLQLRDLANEFLRATVENPQTSTVNVQELVDQIKAAGITRNVLCHGSWMVPDQDGKSLPRFTRRVWKTKELQVFETEIDIDYLRQVQRHVAELNCAVIDTVIHMGYRFPGSTGPGTPLWP